VTARHGASAAQPLFDLAFNAEEIKARLNAVPVFTVVNSKNEFVLVSGEVRGHSLVCTSHATLRTMQRRCGTAARSVAGACML